MKYVVELNNLAEYDKATDIFAELGCYNIQFITKIATFILECDVKFNADDYPVFRHSFENVKHKANFTPNDASVATQMWHLDRIKAPQAWDKSFGQGVKVAVVDTGVNPTHPDLVNNLILPGWCVVTNSTTTTDMNGHGTWVSGFIGAQGNNVIGVTGVAPMAKLTPVRISNTVGGDAYTSDMVLGLAYAADIPDVKVICMTFSMFGVIPQFQTVLDYIASKDISLFNSAGNDGTEVLEAHDDQFTWCGGINASNTRIYNYGVGIDVVAPASGLSSTHYGGGYSINILGGTSFSAPITAGACAVLRAAYPKLSYLDIRRILCYSANSTLNGSWTAGWDKYKGWGCIDIDAALTMAATWKRRNYRKPVALFNNIAEGDIYLVGEAKTLSLRTDATYGNLVNSKLYIDGVEVATGTTLSSYSYTFATQGSHTFTLVVTDDIENIVTTSVSVEAILSSAVINSTSLSMRLGKAAAWEVRVRAKNVSGAGSWSPWTALTVNTAAPSAPTVNVDYSTPGVARIKSGQASSATGYSVLVNDVAVGTLTPTTEYSLPLTNAEQIVKVVPSSANGSGSFATVTVESMPQVVTDLACWYAVGNTTTVATDAGYTYNVAQASSDVNVGVSGSQQQNACNTVSLLQTHKLGLSSSQQQTTCSTMACLQTHMLGVSGSQQQNACSTVPLLQTHKLGLSSSQQQTTCSTMACLQTHMLGVGSSQQQGECNAISMQGASNYVGVAGCTQSITCNAITVQQTVSVGVAASATQPQVSVVNAQIARLLSFSDSVVVPSSTVIAVLQSHRLGVSGAVSLGKVNGIPINPTLSSGVQLRIRRPKFMLMFNENAQV